MAQWEANFDGLVGPTHHYGGLSYGNLASQQHAQAISYPKQAALQGLHKMQLLSELGLMQGVIAPQERPAIAVLRQLGFSGSETQVLEKAYQTDPLLLAACSSASSMWAANAATISPSADTKDGRIHLTPANLVSKFHRAIEPDTTALLLARTFVDEQHFCHHKALPATALFGDEGAANHTRLCASYHAPGVELFVYGRRGLHSQSLTPSRFPARQTLEASQAIARLHGLSPSHTVFAAQHPTAIDHGAFHNDVIAVGNQNVLFYHEQAFIDSEQVTAELQHKLGTTHLHLIKVTAAEIPLSDAIKSYLFNSQLVTLKDNHMALIAPSECATLPSVKAYLAKLPTLNTPIKAVHYIDVKQSMHNGGGPACLRLRVAMNAAEVAATNAACWLDDRLHQRLSHWIHKHYRDQLTLADLRDPALLEESRGALDELTQILNLGSVYPFQGAIY